MTAQQMARLWQERAGIAPRAIDNALTRAAQVVQSVSRLQMERLIYSKPPDLKRNGEPKWKQTRRLIEAERARAEPETDAVILSNATVYARARHELGRDGRKTTRIAHWRDEAEEVMQERFAALIEQAVTRIWGS